MISLSIFFFPPKNLSDVLLVCNLSDRKLSLNPVKWRTEGILDNTSYKSCIHNALYSTQLHNIQYRAMPVSMNKHYKAWIDDCLYHSAAEFMNLIGQKNGVHYIRVTAQLWQ